MNRAPDFLVVGGGMAGVACAAELASHGSVLLLERESSLAYHTTGRSAAISMESYGNTLIQALQRTVVVVDPGSDVSQIPYVGTVDEQIFIKPDVGRLMVSPCDETPSAPCDTLPDELGVAIAMDRLEQATTLRPQRVLNRWAGLRVFVPDRSPLIGADPYQPGLHWCAALGGYGIQTAPAVGALCAAQVTGTALSAEMAQLPIKLASPERTFSADQTAVVPVADLS